MIVDTGSSDKTIAVAKEFGARVVERPDLTQRGAADLVRKYLPDQVEVLDGHPQIRTGFLLDFSEARQIAADEAENDVIFWIDADDVLEEAKPGLLREFVDRAFLEGKGDSIFLDYHYAFDPDDNRCTTVLKRERILDRRRYYWAGRCHETMLPRPDAKGSIYVPDLPSRIKHTEHRKAHKFSDVRNYTIIRNEVEEAGAAGERVDPRSIFYLANAARGLRRFSEAIKLYTRLLSQSGSRDDCFSAAYYIGITYIHDTVRRPTAALDWFFRCIRIKPDDPRGYFGLSRCYYLLKRSQESLHWFRTGAQLPEPKASMHSYDPEHIYTLPLQIAALAAKDLGDENLAQGFARDLAQRRPNHPDTHHLQSIINNWIAGRNLTRSVEAVGANSERCTNINNPLERQNAIRSVVSTLKNVPEELETRGLGKIEPRTNRRVCFFSGPTAETWGPQSAKDGIGGSEKMVIELSKRLQAIGVSCAVYGNIAPNQRGLDKETGVVWRHFSEFDYDTPRRTVVFWRSPASLDLPILADRKVVWCHDVQNPANWTPQRLAVVDKVVVLSKYHASTLGAARVELERDNKLIISRNGVDSALYDLTGAKRDPNKFIYTSSPDRGLLTAIELFQHVKAWIPEATLDVYYGFTPLYWKVAANYEYGHIPDLGHDANKDEYAECVYKTIDNNEDIEMKGRVGFEEMAKAQREAGVWIYPTRFPEISCMAAMEAQAAGCVVAASQYYALHETVDWKSGHVVAVDPDAPRSEEAEGIVQAMERATDTSRKALSDSAKRRFDMDALAKEWKEKIV